MISPQPSFVYGRHIPQSLAADQLNPTDKNRCLDPTLLQNSTVYKARFPYTPSIVQVLKASYCFPRPHVGKLKIPEETRVDICC